MNGKLATKRQQQPEQQQQRETAKRETNRCGEAKSKRTRNLQAAVRWFDGSMGSAGNTRRSDWIRISETDYSTCHRRSVACRKLVDKELPGTVGRRGVGARLLQFSINSFVQKMSQAAGSEGGRWSAQQRISISFISIILIKLKKYIQGGGGGKQQNNNQAGRKTAGEKKEKQKQARQIKKRKKRWKIGKWKTQKCAACNEGPPKAGLQGTVEQQR